jgi:chemotaxis family two-component system sensor kinase Cph1
VIESIVQKFPMWIDDAGDTASRPYVGGIAIDITARQRSEERIRGLVEELENLAYVVSHELQEPVNTIKSYQNLLAVRYKDRFGQDADSFIQKCSDAAITIDRMVTDLWVCARITKQTDFTEIDSARALGAAIDRLSPLILATSSKIRYGELSKILAVGKQIENLFEQLIKNALQNSSDPVVSIECHDSGHMVEFCIADNGTGLDPMIAKDVFKFFKRNSAQRPDSSGSGMGLPICQRIVEHHGGHLRVESQPGSGAKFYFTLPRATE